MTPPPGAPANFHRGGILGHSGEAAYAKYQFMKLENYAEKSSACSRRCDTHTADFSSHEERMTHGLRT